MDDEIASIKIVKRFVNTEKYGIELIGEARNGVEAMNIINSSNPPDLVITDMNMPVMDGVLLLQYLVDCHPEIRIIVASGYYNFPYMHAAIKANVHDYLLKPINSRELDKAVAGCCEELKKRSHVAVNAAQREIHVDLETYRRVLKLADEMNEMTGFGNRSSLDQLLSQLDELIRGYESPELMAELVRKVMPDTLRRFCIEKSYAVPEEKPQSAEASVETVTEDLRRLYTGVMDTIVSQRQQASMDQSLEEIHQYILDHYRESIRLESIAQMFHFNKEYLTTLFRKKYGENVGELIIRLKIDDAKRQIIYSNNKFEEIAESLGYADPSYFYRQFKKTVGMSPGRFRKVNKDLLEE